MIKINAYAKINLFLDITGRREDGYHLLYSVMQSVGLCDTVEISETTSGAVELSCSDCRIPSGEKNIAHKAAREFISAFSPDFKGLKIYIEKRIPSEAGLAGGSADAAAVLVGLDRLYGANIPESRLCELGATIGADVPFCIVGGTMLCEGIGDRLTPVAPLPDCFLLLCKPPVGVSTKAAYEAADNCRASIAPSDREGFMAALQSADIARIAPRLRNVFEEALKLPEIEGIKECMLRCGAEGACMTGSGSCVFGIFSSEDKAKECERVLSETYSEVFLVGAVARGIAENCIGFL
ncbi:MAG: 4-(cytidine 5'-diphospho)-2-C-methyl-D-erythritol kinase [Oscillospiraceae bacterium]|jgi:4-diphosphocytidyl-2-C-methyl-D-erythritol kinase|nr:4-(cytidine 5'-diphospho)-2-C-methyl-D-erythritol kinase [Oscillospiraceae bacterium]